MTQIEYPRGKCFLDQCNFFSYFENCYIHHFEATSCQLIRGDPSGQTAVNVPSISFNLAPFSPEITDASKFTSIYP